MKTLFVILFSLVSIASLAQKQEATKKQKLDSVTVEIPVASQNEIQGLQSQLQKFQDQNWVREQQLILSDKINLIYRTLLVAKGIDPAKIDNAKSTVTANSINVKYKDE